MTRLCALALALGAVACTVDDRVALVHTDAGVDAPAERADASDGADSADAADKPDAADGPADALPSRFPTLPAGSVLPDDETCAALVQRTGFEPRPGNTTANHVVPTAAQLAGLAPWNSENAYDNRALTLEARISGAFTGTTDELIQWVACKWGFDENHIRAEAVQASNWTQTLVSDWSNPGDPDCPPNATTRNNGAQCGQTYGMFQIVWQYHQSAWPMFRDSTPFHLDYIFALRRACFEGWDASQGARATSGVAYTANDEWGCVGAHFSGGWYDDGANIYINAVKKNLAQASWTLPGF